MPDAPPKPRRRLIRALVVVVLALAALALVAYAARRTIARQVLVGWLKARGVASEAEIDRIGLGGLSGRVRIGDPRSPDFTAADVEAAYGFRGLSLELTSVTLKKPVLRARVRAGQLSMGSLDPIIAEFRRRPPRPNVRQPRVRIEDGVVLLATDYGPLRLGADVLVADGKLVSLTASNAPAALKGPDFAAAVGPGVLRIAVRGPRTDLRLDLPIVSAAAAGGALGPGRLQLTGDLPYPDLKRQRGDGAFTIAGRLSAARATAAGQALQGADLALGFSGRVSGWIATLAVSGKGAANLAAASADFGGGRSGALHASVAADDLRWTRSGGDRLAATARLTATGERFALGDLTLRELVLAGHGPVSADRSGVRAVLGGSALGRGGWTGLGAPARGDDPQLAAIKRAARGFRFAAPAVQLALGPEPSARLVQPLVVRPDSGGQLRLAMDGPETARLTVAGGGLPSADATLHGIRIADGRASADLALKAALSFGMLEGGEIDAAGRAVLANGTLTYAAARCATVRAARFDFGERDIQHISGRLCPSGPPLFTASGGDWRVAGRVQGGEAEAPFLLARVTGGAGPVVFSATGGRLAAVATIEAARVSDLTAEPRYYPLAMTGRATLARDVWIADLDFATPAGAHVATAALRHEVVSGKGGVDISTGRLMFAEGGLQPAQLSPLAAAIASPATGEASFSGGFAWLAEAGFSVGTLKIPRLDFVSPAGPVTGLSGEVAFTSLAPLVAAPGQQLRAERLDALVPILDPKVSLEIRDETLRLSGGEATIEGGLILLESLEVPMTPEAALKGVLRLDGVQLKNLVEASPFGSWMDLDAKVTGRIPFETQGGKVRIASGNLEAIAPGRLTIRRELFTGGAAEVKTDVAGVTPAADQNQTFTDMAYQAMEDLAFTELGATLNSLPNGRMGVLFHIKGRHDPPKKQQIKLTVMDLIRKRFLGKPLPLPSGTQVNLTLDTTLNLDDLLADYAEFRRTRGSAQVQP